LRQVGRHTFIQQKAKTRRVKKGDEERVHSKGFFPVILTSSLENALAMPSKNPISICVDLERATTRVVRCGEKASANCMLIEVLRSSDKTFIFVIFILHTIVTPEALLFGTLVDTHTVHSGQRHIQHSNETGLTE